MQKQLKDNIKLYLTTKFNDFTRHFKYNEEIYIRKYKELCGEDLDKINNNIENNNNDNYLFKTEKYDNLKSRDTDLNQLLDSMNNLASTFKDLKNLVVEQGTILDRIDYNIEVASENTKNAYGHINEANKLQSQSCFRNVTLIVMFVIFIEAIMLINKYL